MQEGQLLSEAPETVPSKSFPPTRLRQLADPRHALTPRFFGQISFASLRCRNTSLFFRGFGFLDLDNFYSSGSIGDFENVLVYFAKFFVCNIICIHGCAKMISKFLHIGFIA